MMLESGSRVVRWAIGLAAAAVAFGYAWSLSWSCDDAYISYRYAQHLVEGRGLVFNLDPAEAPVEGYTNFLWTLWLAVGMVLGFTGQAIEGWAAFWGALCHALTVWVLVLAVGRICRGALVPIAALAYAVHHHAASLAPAGLETALFVLLATEMGLQTIEAMRREGDGVRERSLVLGVLGVLAALTRPDGAIFCMAAFGCLCLHGFRTNVLVRTAVRFCLPFVVVFVPYLLWRHWYYGYWVPNTFYAKAAADSYWTQGLTYVLENFRIYWGVAAALVVALALPAIELLPKQRSLLGREGGRPSVPPSLVLLAFVLPYLVFVIYVGGDFMMARFVLPVTPLILLAVDRASQAWPRAGLVVGVVLAGSVCLRLHPEYLHTTPFLEGNSMGFADNRWMSRPELTQRPGQHLMEHTGEALADLWDGLGVRIAIGGGHAAIAYYSQVPVAVEIASGLTDAYIAHLPPPERRSVVGHERSWRSYPRYLDEERRLHFSLILDYGDGSVVDSWRPMLIPFERPNGLDPGSVPMHLVTWDGELMRELKRRQPFIAMTDVEAKLDEYLATIDARPRAEIERDFESLQRFYFSHNDDPVRLQQFRAALAD